MQGTSLRDKALYDPQQSSIMRRFKPYRIPLIAVIVCVLYFVVEYTILPAPRAVTEQQDYKTASEQPQYIDDNEFEDDVSLLATTPQPAALPKTAISHPDAAQTYTQVVQHAIRGGKLWEAPSAIMSHREHQEILSPNRNHRLMLDQDGNLRLERKDIRGAWETTWTPSTGSEKHTAQAGTNFVTADPDGVLRVQTVTNHEKQHKADANVTTVWHSDMLAQCKNGNASETAYSVNTLWPASVLSESQGGMIRLHNNGRFEVHSQLTAASCVIHPGDSTSLDEAEQWGRLAVIVTGLYRTLNETCHSHMSKVIEPWAGTGVDVFIYTYHTTSDPTERQTQLDQLHTCYGSCLANVVFAEQTAVEEPLPSTFQRPQACPIEHTNRLRNQLKTLALAHDVFQRHQIRTGTTYNAVLRLRPDTDLSVDDSPDVPRLRNPGLLGPNTLLIPHPRGEHYFYCPSYSGDWKIGTSDQLIYGSVAAAAQWFNLFYRFDAMMALNAEVEVPYAPFMPCEVIPGGGERPACRGVRGCAIECLVSWYLSLVGVEFEVDWSWPMRVYHGY
ncbi:hypothetical protein MBLNU457_4271t1 [Dothideomycetes sp. NU457]